LREDELKLEQVQGDEERSHETYPKRSSCSAKPSPAHLRPAEFIEKDAGCIGTSSYRENRIVLRPSLPTYPLNQEQLEQAFCHEVVHFLLYHAGAAYSGKTDYMHQDEGFVDLLASLLPPGAGQHGGIIGNQLTAC